MDTGLIINTMRDPAGIPASPHLFQALMVGTWVLHIAFVVLTLGAATLSIYAFYKSTPNSHWERLSMALTKVAKIGVSLLIVLGVAPLLFTQTIYDPQWYASNVLSAGWAIGFIFTLIVGYCLWFVFYMANHEGAKKHIGLYAVIGLAMFLLDGLIMHALSYQALLPGEWMNWYAPGGIVDNSGSQLHAIQWTRFAFTISLSAPAVGLFMLAYSDYFSVRSDYPEDYRGFVRNIGLRLARIGLPVSLALFLAWMFDMPAKLGLSTHPVGWLLFATLSAMAAWVWRITDGNGKGYSLVGMGSVMLLILAVWREVVRIHYLTPFDYDIATYAVHMDWPSTILFFGTLIGIGGLVGGFYVATVYRAGRVQGVYEAEAPVARLGNYANAVLVLWMLANFAYGIVIFLNNEFVF